MTDYPRGTESPTESSASLELVRDAQILHDTVREAVRTSPHAFLRTVSDVDAKSLDYWIDEIQSSTWAVAQRDGEVVGVAAGKHPDPDKDEEDQLTSRYIESVWISPELRGHRLGERLIKYLLEAEYRKNQYIKQFLLWVFTTNSSAISLYRHMGFVRMPEEHKGIRTQIKYRLDFDCEVYAAVGLAVNEAVRRQDQRQYGVTYRVLGEKDSA